MRTLRIFSVVLSTIALLFVLGFVNGQRSASAHTLIPSVTCSGNSCNGTDPYATGCAGASDGILDHATVRDANGNTLADVQLHWSVVCGTLWNVTNQFCLPNAMTATVSRMSGPDGGSLTYTTFSSACSTWTQQVYAHLETGRACTTVKYGATGRASACTPYD